MPAKPEDEDTELCLALLARASWFYSDSFSIVEAFQTCSVSLSGFHGALPRTGDDTDRGRKAGLWNLPFSI